MRFIKHLSLFTLVIFTLVCCTPKKKLAVDTSFIEVDFEIIRFDSIFYNTQPGDFAKLKLNYGYLLPNTTSDSVWKAKIIHPDSRYLYKEVQKVFPDFNRQKNELIMLFKHFKYYFKKFKSPKIVTLISDIDYNNKVIYADSLMFISLDMYLGSTHGVYQNFPKYIKATYTKSYIIVDVAKAIAQKSISGQKSRTFISSCIQQGKLVYATQAFLPKASDSILMGYTKTQIAWAKANQEFVWKYFIENKMIFNTDKRLVSRFLSDAPFSKFYLENDKYIPSRIGVFIGWQIVRSYMQNNDLNFTQMLQIPNETIFKQSKYKPRN